MTKGYESPEIVAINLDELTVLLRCACTADDNNPYIT